MATSPIRFAGDSNITTAHTTGDKVYFRSTDATDDGDFQCYGADGSGDLQGLEETVATNAGLVGGIFAVFNTVTLFKAPSATAGAVSVYSNDGTPSTAGIHINSQPSDADTIIIGPTGFTTTYTFKTTVASPGHVKIGSDVNETADNLASAINDTSTGPSTPVDSTDWNASAANTEYTASVSGSDVTVTGIREGKYGVTLVITPSNGSSVGVSSLTQGVDGTLIGTIAIGNTSLSTSSGGVILSSADQTTTTLPPNLTGASVGVKVSGQFVCNIRLGSAPNASVTSKIQMSHDNVNWWDAPWTSIIALNTDQEQLLYGSDLFAEYARFNITANSATNETEADIVFVY